MVASVSLDGSWSVAQLDGAAKSLDVSKGLPANLTFIPAAVPGVVQYDLVSAGQLGNPFSGLQGALDAAWVAETDWVYKLDFDFSAKDGKRWVLQVDGIDTYAAIWINGALVGETYDAYMTFQFPVDASLLKQGTNELVVHVKAHSAMVADKVDAASTRMALHDGPRGKLGKALIRRYQRSFFAGSSLLNVGTSVLGIGIFRPIRLVNLPDVHVKDVFVQTEKIGNAEAVLDVLVTVDAEEAVKGVSVEVEVLELEGGKAVVSVKTDFEVKAGSTSKNIAVKVPHPKLWWPRGYGEPNLYTIRVTASTAHGVISTSSSEFGIRTVTLLQQTPTGRPTFQFVVNDTPIYAMGTNLIPLDYLKIHADASQYKRVFALLGAQHCNILRMWGGGAVESDEFYREADRTGLMIWQDFYLHSNLYPDYDEEWVAVFRAECADILRRLRTHPSLVLVCGGNETREGWDHYGWKTIPGKFYGERLITETVPNLLKELPSGVPYIDNSPHGGVEAQSPVRGDGHIWGNHFNSLKDPLFVTETCWGLDSYSRPETLLETMHLDADSPEFSTPGWPERWKARCNLPLLVRAPFSGAYNVASLRTYLRSTELEQGLADYFSLANFRFRSPSNNGIVYWSFNKGGPLFQFGSIDYGLRPMVSHYVIARLYQEVAVNIRREAGNIEVLVSNRSTSTVESKLEVVHAEIDGKIHNRWTTTLAVAPGPTVTALLIPSLYPTVVDRNRELAFVRLSVAGEQVADEILYLSPIVEIDTSSAPISVSSRSLPDGSYALELETSQVCKMVEIEAGDDVQLSDNYFGLVVGFPKTVVVKSYEGKALKGVEVKVGDVHGTKRVTHVL